MIVYGKYRPILDFFVLLKIQDQLVRSEHASHSMLAAQTPQKVSELGSLVGGCSSSPSKLLAYPKPSNAQSARNYKSSLILESGAPDAFNLKNRFDEMVLMYATLTFLVDKLQALGRDADTEMPSRRLAMMKQQSRVHLKDSLPTVVDTD